MRSDGHVETPPVQGKPDVVETPLEAAPPANETPAKLPLVVSNGTGAPMGTTTPSSVLSHFF